MSIQIYLHFGKFTFYRTSGAHKLLHYQPFLDYLYKLSHLLSALRIKQYVALTASVKVCIGDKILYYIFIFDRNFAKLVAPPSDGNENYVVHLKFISWIIRFAVNYQISIKFGSQMQISIPSIEIWQKIENFQIQIGVRTSYWKSFYLYLGALLPD